MSGLKTSFFTRFAPLLVLASFAHTAGSADALAAGAAGTGLERFNEAFNAKDYLTAQQILSALLRADPRSGLYWLNQGNLHLAQNHYAEGADAYQQASALSPEIAPFAKVYQARCQWRLGKFEPALKGLGALSAATRDPDLRAAYEEEAQRARDALYRVAYVDYQSGRFSAAYRRLAFLAGHQAGSPLDLLLGLTFLALGRPDWARVELKFAAAGPPEDPYAERAREALRSLSESDEEARTVGRSASGLLEIAGGNNSNISSAAISSNGLTAPEYSRRIAQGLAAGRLPLATTPSVWTDLELVARWDEAVGLTAARGQLLQARVPVSYHGGSALIAEVAPQLRYELVNLRPQFIRPGLRVKAGSSGASSAYYLLAEGQANVPTSPDTGYLRGFGLSATFNYRRTWSRLLAEAFAGYVREGTREFRMDVFVLPLSYQGPTVGLWTKWQLSPDWSLALQPSWTWKYFKVRAEPDDLQRVDLAIETFLRFEWRAGAAWSIFNSWNLEVNQSTMGADRFVDKNYHQVRTLIGLSRDLGRD